jgi:hypothetical protein
MGTRIEEAIVIISDIDKAYRTFTPEEIRALETTLNVMRKYQKIQNIAENYDKGILEENDGVYAFKQIRKVLEDGNEH